MAGSAGAVPTEKIAFTSDRDGDRGEIYSMDADGSNQLRLTDSLARDSGPSWSPSGVVAFATDRDGNWEIYTVNAYGGDLQRLTQDGALDDEPAFSPNGTQIAFQSTRAVFPDIWVMNADGSSPTRLTADSHTDNMPSWSPSGSQIAFASNRSGAGDIYSMAASGVNLRRLTTGAVADSAVDFAPSWSPDGREIAFMSNRDGDYEIYTMPAAGSANPRKLTDNSVSDTAPDWSPDGTQIGYDTRLTGNIEVFKMDAQSGGAQQNISQASGSRDDSPSWERVDVGLRDLDCDGDPFNNHFAVHDFTVSTDTSTAGAPSRLRLAGLICGAELTAGGGGTETITDHVDVMQAKGSLISTMLDANNFPTGSYAGSVSGRIALHDSSGTPTFEATTGTLRIDPLSLHLLGLPFGTEDDCNREAEGGLAGNNVGSYGSFDYGAAPSVIFSCFKVTGQLSAGTAWWAWAWVTLSGQGHWVDTDPTDENPDNPRADDRWEPDHGAGRRFLTLGPVHIDGSPQTAAGFTRITTLEICANRGDPADDSCGTAEKSVLHRNGRQNVANCGDGGEGLFEVVATNKAAAKTAGPQPVGNGGDAVTSCVQWTGARGGTGVACKTKRCPTESRGRLPAGR